MLPESIFQICSTIALTGWIILIFVSPFWWGADKLLTGFIVSLLALVYAWLVFISFDFSGLGKFGSFDGVMQLFQDKTVVTAGWIHYLAFDLFTGTWISKNAVKHNISHGLVVPSLLLTFMFGPIGLLLYFITRAIKTKNYFAESFE